MSTVTVLGVELAVESDGRVYRASDWTLLPALEERGFLTRRTGSEWNFGHDVWFVA